MIYQIHLITVEQWFSNYGPRPTGGPCALDCSTVMEMMHIVRYLNKQNYMQRQKLKRNHTLATKIWLVMFVGSMPRSCNSCTLKSSDTATAFPIIASGCVDICDTGPIPVAGRPAGAAPVFNLPPEPMCMRRSTSSSFSCKSPAYVQSYRPFRLHRVHETLTTVTDHHGVCP